MARKARFSIEEIARMCELRDKATTAMELRKALSVLLVSDAGLNATKTAEVLGISERTIFRNRSDVRHQGEGKREHMGRSTPLSHDN